MTEDLIAIAREIYGTEATEQEIRFAALIEARAVARTREECAVEASSWKRSKLLLHAGEMTAQERRTCEAVSDGIAASIRALGERT